MTVGRQLLKVTSFNEVALHPAYNKTAFHHRLEFASALSFRPFLPPFAFRFPEDACVAGVAFRFPEDGLAPAFSAGSSFLFLEELESADLGGPKS